VQVRRVCGAVERWGWDMHEVLEAYVDKYRDAFSPPC